MSATIVCDGHAWVVARTKPQQEGYALKNVVRQGYEAYLPRCIEPRTRRVAPLFPGYLFVNAPQRWRWLCSTYGILTVILSTDGAPSQLPSRVIEDIRAREDKGGHIKLPTGSYYPGQRLRINDGLFRGEVGMYQEDRAMRIRVLLNILGAPRAVEVPHRMVEPV